MTGVGIELSQTLSGQLKTQFWILAFIKNSIFGINIDPWLRPILIHTKERRETSRAQRSGSVDAPHEGRPLKRSYVDVFLQISRVNEAILGSIRVHPGDSSLNSWGWPSLPLKPPPPSQSPQNSTSSWTTSGPGLSVMEGHLERKQSMLVQQWCIFLKNSVLSEYLPMSREIQFFSVFGKFALFPCGFNLRFGS